MEVILREDIEKLGNRGEVVKVASGYARNFLIPKRLAVEATDSNKKIVEQERQAHIRKEHKLKSESLKGERAVTVYTPAGHDPAKEACGLLVLFDDGLARALELGERGPDIQAGGEELEERD